MNEFSKIIQELRKSKGMSQEKLAAQFGISVQAVSKWECAQSYPDITLLPQIAELFDVSIDYLLTGKDRAGHGAALDLPTNDGKLRILQFRGREILTSNTYDPDVRIMLQIDENLPEYRDCNIEIWGSADIKGGVNGDITAGGYVKCGFVRGSVSADGDVSCGTSSGGVTAGGNVCVHSNMICGDISAEGNVACNNVGGGVTAGGDVRCNDVGGDVSAECNVNCGNVEKNITAGGDVHAKEIHGDVKSDGKVILENGE